MKDFVSLLFISSLQSLDYDTPENTLYFKEQKSYTPEVSAQGRSGWNDCFVATIHHTLIACA